MASEIIATGTGSATSSDVVVGAGESLAVGLKGLPAGTFASVRVELYDGAAYQYAGSLDSDTRLRVISAPGTYRFIRTAGTCGVFSG